jgi:flagellar hook-length control protein FliK
MAGKEEPVKTAPLQATHQAVATQPGAARAFEEGVTRTDGGSSSAAADKAPTQTTAEGDGQSKPVAAKAEGQPAPAASSGAPAPATAPPANPCWWRRNRCSPAASRRPASVPGQPVSRAQADGSHRAQRSPRARSEVKVDVKQKAAELTRGGTLESSETTTTPESSRSQQVQQNSQPQAVGHDNRPAATEAAARREPANLPHLKLADPEAPAQLHQKVNLMLADKLQQAEIQLDPLGLGKMKIQIQMGASSQANVHFVVQHGQTRCWSRPCPGCVICWPGRASSWARPWCNNSRSSSHRASRHLPVRASKAKKAADLLPKQAKLRQRSRALACVCRRNRQTTAELISMLDASPSKFMIPNKFETRVDKGWQTITN